MYQVPLGGQTLSTASVSIDTNISSTNASINNMSVTNATIGNLKATLVSQNTMNVSILNASQLNLPEDYIIPRLNVSELISAKENFTNMSATNISAVDITATNVCAPNLQGVLTEGQNIVIDENNVRSAINQNLPASANFSILNISQMNASNISTGNLTIGNTMTLSNKLLNVNSTNNVTQNSGDLITSGAVYNALNGTGVGDTRNLTNTEIYNTQSSRPLVIRNTTVNSGETKTIIDAPYSVKFGTNSMVSVSTYFTYEVAGNGGDKIEARLRVQYNNGTINTIAYMKQIWVNAGGGGTRSGTLGPLQGAIKSNTTGGLVIIVEITNRSNESDDQFRFLNTDLASIIVTESLVNTTGSDLNLNTGNIQADEAIFNTLSILEGSGAGQANIGRAVIGNDAFSNMMAISINGNTGATNYGFAQIENGPSVMNAQVGSFNSFRYGNIEVATISPTGLGIQLEQGANASFALHVVGTGFFTSDLFCDEIDCNRGLMTNVSAVNVDSTNICCTNLKVSGTLDATGLNLSTANLIPGDNIQIVDDVISAFLGADSIVNINSLHSDGNVDVVGALNVCLTSTFGGALNVSNTIYSGVAGQHEGSLVLYSNILGNNFQQIYNASGTEVDITATGTATAINYFVGGTNVLRISPNAFEVNAIDAVSINASNGNFSNVATLAINACTCVFNDIGCEELIGLYVQSTNITATSNFTSPSADITNITGTNVCVTGNISCLNFSADLVHTENIVVTDLFDCADILTTNIVSTNGEIENMSSDNISASFITASNTLNCGNVFVTNICCGDILANGRISCEELNISENISATRHLFANNLSANLADITTGNFSLINASNISGYQETLIAGANISIVGNTISTLAEPIPADINFSSINASSANISRLVLDGDGQSSALDVPFTTANFFNAVISNSFQFTGSDCFFGSPTQQPNSTTGGDPRSRINFFSSNASFETGMRFGINEANQAQMKLETQFGNVSRFNININNISVLDIDNNSTKISNDLFVRTINNSFINTSFVTCNDEASFRNGVNVTGEVACDELDTDQVFTINLSAFVLDADFINSSNVVNVSEIIGADCDFGSGYIQSFKSELINASNMNLSNTLNASVVNVSQINASNLSTATMNFGADLTFDTFSNTLSLTTTPEEAISDIETNGLVTSSVNTSSLNVDGITSLDVVSVSIGLNSLVANINTINSSGSANISVGNFSTINASNISGYQETLIAGNNISIVGNTISSAGEPLPTDPNFSSVNTSTLNASVVNGDNLSTATMVFTSDFNLQSFGNVLSLTKPLLSVNQIVAGLTSKDVVTKSLNTSSLNVDGLTSFDVVSISLGLNSTNNNLFNINSSGTANISTGNFSTINASNLSTATMNFGADLTFDTFSNTLSLTTTPEEAVSNIETNGLVTTGVNTSSLNVDGITTLDIVAVSVGLNSLVGNINTINSSGSANISVGNFSTIIADNISGYQETLIAGNNISIVGNTISSTGGGALPATANFSEINVSNINVSTINGGSTTGLGAVAIGKINGDGTNLFVKGCSVTRTGVGRYTCIFNTARTNTNYVVQLTSSEPTNTIDDVIITFDNESATTTQFSYSTHEQDNGTIAGIYRDRAHFVSVFDDDVPLIIGGGGTLPADANFSSVTTTTLNASTINASNIVGYQESLIAGDNITIVGNTISSTGGGGGGNLPADANFSSINVTGDVEIAGKLNSANDKIFNNNQVVDLEGLTNYNLRMNEEWLTSDFVRHNNGLFTFQNLPGTDVFLFIVTALISVESDVYDARVNWRLTPFLNNANYNGYGNFYTSTEGATQINRYSTLMVRTLVGAKNGQVYRLNIDCNKEGDNTFGSSMNGLRIRNAPILTFLYVGPYNGQQYSTS